MKSPQIKSRKINKTKKDDYSVVMDPVPQAVAEAFVQEMKLQGRSEAVCAGCYPATSGQECILLMSDWIGNDELFHDDLRLIHNLHAQWLRKVDLSLII